MIKKCRIRRDKREYPLFRNFPLILKVKSLV